MVDIKGRAWQRETPTRFVCADGSVVLCVPEMTDAYLLGQVNAGFAPVPPDSVSMAQARAALIVSGLMPAVQAALLALPGIEGELARNSFEYATVVQRDDPLVQGLAAQLPMSQAQLDALFLLAQTL